MLWTNKLAASLAAMAFFWALSMAPSVAQEADEPPPAVSVEEAHKALLDDPEMQLERPSAEATPPRDRQRNRRSWGIGDFFAGVFGALGPVFRIIFYVGIAAVVGFILYFIARNLLGVRLGGSEDDEEAGVADDVFSDVRPDAAAARSLLEEADALAREGKFAEAVHLLLFRSIEDIQTRKSGGLPRSLTAREIGRLGALPEAARAALGPIIRIVERSFFGGRAVDEAGWKEARTSYEFFAFGESWS